MIHRIVQNRLLLYRGHESIGIMFRVYDVWIIMGVCKALFLHVESPINMT